MKFYLFIAMALTGVSTFASDWNPVESNIQELDCSTSTDGIFVPDFKEWFRQSTSQGLQCFRGISEKTAESAVKIDNILKNDEVRIACTSSKLATGTKIDFGPKLGMRDPTGDSVASAFRSKGDPRAYGMFLFTDVFPKSVNETSTINQTLLHEMIHWLGYRHGKGFDLAYLAESCCFESDENIKAASCSVIQENSSPSTLKYWNAILQSLKSADRIYLGFRFLLMQSISESSTWLNSIVEKEEVISHFSSLAKIFLTELAQSMAVYPALPISKSHDEDSQVSEVARGFMMRLVPPMTALLVAKTTADQKSVEEISDAVDQAAAQLKPGEKTVFDLYIFKSWVKISEKYKDDQGQ